MKIRTSVFLLLSNELSKSTQRVDPLNQSLCAALPCFYRSSEWTNQTWSGRVTKFPILSTHRMRVTLQFFQLTNPLSQGKKASCIHSLFATLTDPFLISNNTTSSLTQISTYDHILSKKCEDRERSPQHISISP